MTALSRADAIHPSLDGRVATLPRRLTFIRVFCWMQVIMVVMNLGRIPVLSTDDRDFPLSFDELCLGVMLVAALLTVKSWRSIRVDGVSVAALVFALVGAGSAVWSIQRFDLTGLELLVSLSYLARWVMYFALYFALINVLRRQDVESVWSAVEMMLVIFGAFGIVQSAFFPGFAQMVDPHGLSYTWDQQGRRLVSTALEPNIAGTMLMVGFLVQLSRVSTGAAVKWWKVLIMLTALVLTISRSAAVGLFFGLLVIFVARGLSRRLVRWVVPIGAMVLLSSPLILQYAIQYNKFMLGEGTSAGARVTSWLQAIQVIADHPIFGIGFNAYRYAVDHYGFELAGSASYGVDGGLLFILAMTGLVGLTVYCVMLWLVLRRCRRIRRDAGATPGEQGIAIGAASSILAVVTASAFVNAILTTFVMEILWVLWALTFVVEYSRLAERSDLSSATGTKLVSLAAR